MSAELTRLHNGPDPGERPDGLLAALIVNCSGDAAVVLRWAKDVLTLVLQQPDPSMISIERWRELLPDWFVRRCAPEITKEEAERRRLLPTKERIALAEHWSLGGWIYWFRPNERWWKWWDDEVTSPNVVRVRLVVPGFPYPSGAVEWLLAASGASSIDKLD
jgi:hypothetical protein